MNRFTYHNNILDISSFGRPIRCIYVVKFMLIEFNMNVIKSVQSRVIIIGSHVKCNRVVILPRRREAKSSWYTTCGCQNCSTVYKNTAASESILIKVLSAFVRWMGYYNSNLNICMMGLDMTIRILLFIIRVFLDWLDTIYLIYLCLKFTVTFDSVSLITWVTFASCIKWSVYTCRICMTFFETTWN